MPEGSPPRRIDAAEAKRGRARRARVAVRANIVEFWERSKEGKSD